LYGAALAEGSRRAKREPAISVAGYIARIRVSRGVGRNGGLSNDIFAGCEVVKSEFVDVGSGERFWILCERRGVAEPESMIWDAINQRITLYST
jgi:hypothetical protein